MLIQAPAQPSDLQPERLFGRLGLLHRPTVIVAVSGGSDSLSLLILLHHWFSRHGRADALLAVTVDHALRPGSADEAHAVGALCAERNIPHIIKTWDGPKPSSGLASAARSARYRLLLAAAAEAKTDIILTGHTQDDQVETVAMRAARGEGMGLAGMAPDTLLGGAVWLLRPLLSTSRADLRDYLGEQGLSWIEDPSNSNPAAERVRVRAGMDAEHRAALLRQAADAGVLRRGLAERAAVLIAAQFCVEPQAMRIPSDFFQASDQDAAVHALRLALCVLGKQAHWPDLPRTRALFAALGEVGFSGSLAGCVVAHRRAGITLRPERRGKASTDDGDITKMFADQVLRPIIPGFDLPALGALAALLGARDLPRSPLCRLITAFP